MPRGNEYNGHGRLAEEDGVLISTAGYRVVIFQKMIPDGFGGEIPGMLDVRGSINGVEPHIMLALAQAQRPLMLLMDDDHVMLRIFVSGANTFTGRGGRPLPLDLGK